MGKMNVRSRIGGRNVDRTRPSLRKEEFGVGESRSKLFISFNDVFLPILFFLSTKKIREILVFALLPLHLKKSQY